MEKPIKFGTDGWRAVIGEDFVPENVERVVQAFCDQQPEGERSKKIFLGYDRRLKSEETARLVAEVLAGNRRPVVIASQFCPTPCISWMVKNEQATAGIMVTASHNPSQWNGIKFKESYGGSASPEYTSRIEAQLGQNDQKGRKIKKIKFEEGKKQGWIEGFDPHQKYGDQLKSLVDVASIKKSGFKVLYDPLFGAGSGFLKNILGGQVDEIHSEADPHFGGLNPEPIDKNLGLLMEKMKGGKWQVGLSTDGDADRIGAVDEEGNFVNSHQIFALLLKHYVEDKGLKGPVVKSVSTTQMIDRLCKKYGLKLFETPIGFKHICKKLVETEALMGGEESGGISFSPHVHERDGLLNGLFLLEMMSQRKKTLKGLISELYREIGPHYFDRLDIHCEPEQIREMQERLSEVGATGRSPLPGQKIASTNFTDGFKYFFEDASWLLIRASGTEPLVRIYAEALSREKVLALLEVGRSFVVYPWLSKNE